MSKKDYQAIAAAIYHTRRDLENDPTKWSAGSILNMVTRAIADEMKADNSAFDRERFIEACETGSCKGMRK